MKFPKELPNLLFLNKGIRNLSLQEKPRTKANYCFLHRTFGHSDYNCKSRKLKQKDRFNKNPIDEKNLFIDATTELKRMKLELDRNIRLQHTKIILDTGSSENYINPCLAQEIPHKKLKENFIIRVANGQEIKIENMVEIEVSFLQISGSKFRSAVYILPRLPTGIFLEPTILL